jgi:hypothetical protein
MQLFLRKAPKGCGKLLVELVTLWRGCGSTSAAVWVDMLQFERKRDALSIDRSFISESQFWGNNSVDVLVMVLNIRAVVNMTALPLVTQIGWF